MNLNELLLAQIVAITTVVLQLLKAYLPILTSDRCRRYLPLASVVLGLLVSVASTLPTSTVGWAWAYATAVYGVIAGLTASGAYDLGIRGLFDALGGIRQPQLPGQSGGGQSPPAPPAS